MCPDHVHMLAEIPPKVAVSGFMGYLKGTSSLMIYEKFPELRYKYRNREFWRRGYYADKGNARPCPIRGRGDDLHIMTSSDIIIRKALV